MLRPRAAAASLSVIHSMREPTPEAQASVPWQPLSLGQRSMADSESRRALARERTRRWRARVRDPLHAPPVRLPGRRPHAGAMGCRSAAQRRRRRRLLHKSLLVRCLQHLLRLKVLPRQNLENCSNVQALLRLEPLLRRRGLTHEARAAVLILVTLIRRPAFTAQLGQECTWASHPSWSAPDALLRIRTLLNNQDSAWGIGFWHGPARLNAEAAACAWTVPQMLQAASAFCPRHHRCDAAEVVKALCEIPQISSYMAYAIARSVALALKVRLWNSAEPASKMSDHVALVTTLVPWADWASLRCAAFEGANFLDVGNVANLLCGLTGVLKCEGILKPLQHYRKHTTKLKKDLCSKSMRSFVHALSRCTPLKPEVLTAGAADKERQLVDRYLPSLSHAFHCSVDWPQTLAKLRAELRSRGWKKRGPARP